MWHTLEDYWLLSLLKNWTCFLFGCRRHYSLCFKSLFSCTFQIITKQDDDIRAFCNQRLALHLLNTNMWANWISKPRQDSLCDQMTDIHIQCNFTLYSSGHHWLHAWISCIQRKRIEIRSNSQWRHPNRSIWRGIEIQTDPRRDILLFFYYSPNIGGKGVILGKRACCSTVFQRHHVVLRAVTVRDIRESVLRYFHWSI